MNLKTSLFDKSTVKSDFKRFWWISVLYIILMAVFILPNAIGIGGMGDIYYRTDEGFLAVVFSFFIAGMVFSYLHKGSAVSCLHGLPITRKKLFLSHVLSSFIILLIPIIISSVIIGIEGIYVNDNITYAIKYFYTCSVYVLIVFSVTLFSVMISGNTVASYIFSIGFIIFPLFVIESLSYILANNLYGFIGSFSSIYKYIYITSTGNMWSYFSLLYIGAGIVLILISYFLYKIRNLENYDEIIAFKGLKPVFMYFVAVCFGIFGYIFINQISDVKSLFLGILPLGCTALIAAFMLNKKEFSIKGIFKPLLIFIIGAGIFNIMFVYDVTGFERRVPDISEIESVDAYGYNFTADNFTSYDINIDYRDIKYKEVLTDKKDIENMLNLHKAAIENRIEPKKVSNVTFAYNLKNGKVLKRDYDLDLDFFFEHLKNYYENPVCKKYRYPLVNDNEKVINYVNCWGINTDMEIRLKEIDNDKLYEAIKKDIFALDFKDMGYGMYNEQIGFTLSVNYDDYVDYNGEKIKVPSYQSIELNRHFKNTLELINKELEKYDNIVTEDKITSADINIYSEEGLKDIILNKDEAREVYKSLLDIDFVNNYADNKWVEFEVSFKGDIKEGTHYISLPYNQVPNPIIKYLDLDSLEGELNNSNSTVVTEVINIE